jgi:hypothetical protein
MAQMHGLTRAFVLAGGVTAWREQGLPLESTPHEPRFAREPPRVQMSRFAQVMNVVAGLGLKPAYMLLVLAMVLALRRVRRAIPVLWHGLLWFFVGEAFCAANLAFHLPGHVYLSDVGHGAGMVAMSALIPWGLYAILDERVLRSRTPPRAAGSRRWRALLEARPVPCGLHDLMMLMLPALAVVSLMPLSGPLRPLQVVADVLGTPTDFGVPVINLFVELRVYPVLGCLGFLLTLALLAGGGSAAVRRRRRSSSPRSADGLLDAALPARGDLPRAVPWSNFWEELTEMFTVLAVGAFLYLFRRQLGLVEAAPAAAPEPAAKGPPAGA